MTPQARRIAIIAAVIAVLLGTAIALGVFDGKSTGPTTGDGIPVDMNGIDGNTGGATGNTA